jgi:hypothetical protein
LEDENIARQPIITFDLNASAISMESSTLSEDNSLESHQPNSKKEHHSPLETKG